MKYDYLIVGAGLFGAVFAREAAKKGRKCLVVEKRNHIAGNIYCEEIHGIQVHRYGAHIFHTSDRKVWDYVNDFAEFNQVYGEYFVSKPARSCVAVRTLPKGVLCEIEAIAVKGSVL